MIKKVTKKIMPVIAIVGVMIFSFTTVSVSVYAQGFASQPLNLQTGQQTQSSGQDSFTSQPLNLQTGVNTDSTGGAQTSSGNVNSVSYVPLAPITGFVQSGSNVNFSDYVNNMYRLGIAVAGVLAVIMIVVGGIEYMTSEAIGKKEEGKDRIWSAIWGLILALASYIILATINPNLLNTSLNVKPVPGMGTTIAQQSFVNQLLGQNGTNIGPGLGGVATELTLAPDGGQTVTTNNVRIDTDGIGLPPYYDQTRSTETNYQPNGQSLDANKDFYVVVPLGSNIPMGTRALIQDNTTGRQVWAVAGDKGPTANGYGEISLAAGVALGATDGKGDHADPNNITITFYP